MGTAGRAIRHRRANEAAQQHQQQAAAQQQNNRQTFNRAYGVCLESRGYKVG